MAEHQDASPHEARPPGAGTQEAADRGGGAPGAADPAAKRRVLNRLRRASGQLSAVIAAVEEGKPCRDVVTQLAAVTSALDRAGFAILSSAMQECIAAPDEALAKEGLTTEEVERLFLMLA